MRKSVVFILGLVLLLAANAMMTGALAKRYDGKAIASGADSAIIAPESITPKAITYAEGLNDDETVDVGSFYGGVDLFGIEYTPTFSYNLKKVELMAGTGTGKFIIQLRNDDAGWPSETVLREASFTMLNTVSWQGAEFGESYSVSAGTTYWIVFEPVASSQASVATSGVLVTHVFDSGKDGWDGKATTVYWMAMFYQEVHEFQYHFKLDPFADVIHMDVNPGGWLNGIDDAITYQGAPVLGYVEYGFAYIAIDFPDVAYWDMAFLVIQIATRDGWMMRIAEDLELAPPEYVWLTPVAEASLEGPSLGEGISQQVTPKAWYYFICNPFLDQVSLNTDGAPWLWGRADIPGGNPCYPAPVLGFTQFGKFYFAMDYVDGQDSCFEMSLWAGTIATRDGNLIRTNDGMSFDGPDYFWLTPP